jgi:hypothetical protein
MIDAFDRAVALGAKRHKSLAVVRGFGSTTGTKRAIALLTDRTLAPVRVKDMERTSTEWASGCDLLVLPNISRNGIQINSNFSRTVYTSQITSLRTHPASEAKELIRIDLSIFRKLPRPYLSC